MKSLVLLLLPLTLNHLNVNASTCPVEATYPGESPGVSYPFLIEGVEINHAYRQPSQGHGVVVSAPGCPPAIDGYPGVHYVKAPNPPRCYLAGFQGPCPANMKMFVVRGSNWGVCHCECSADALKSKSYCYIKDKGYHVAYYQRTNRCYQLFTQGPCSSSKWLVLDANEKPVCQKRRCPIKDRNTGSNFIFYDPTTNQCKKVGDPCRLHGNGFGRYKYEVDKWNFNSNGVPQCYPSISCPIPGILRGAMCPSGKIYSTIFQKCLTKFNAIISGTLG